MSEHDARDAQTPEEMANDIMHEACLPQSLIDKGVHQAMYEAIRDRIREAADAAHAAGKAEGAAEERAGAEILDEEGMDANDKLSKLAGLVLDCRMGTPQGQLAKDYARYCLRRTSKDPLAAIRAREGGDSDG